MPDEPQLDRLWLGHPVEEGRDHIRGNLAAENAITFVLYGDYLCPFCRRLRPVVLQLRELLGDRFVYVFRHFPNEKAHPGATFISRVTEAAARQGCFWQMHDWLFDNPPPSQEDVLGHVRSLGIDLDAFQCDLDSDEVRTRVESDKRRGRHNGVTGTPTIFIDRLRYDGAWDFYSMLEAIEQPIAARVQRSARAFASLPASGGLALLVAAVFALVCANTPLAPLYRMFVNLPLGIGAPGNLLSMPVAAWCSEGLLAIFFLLVGLEIRRELTSGSLTKPRAAALPVISALGGMVAPTGIYLFFNSGPTASGWSVPTATDIAFALGVLALFGSRIPASLRVFVAAFAVVDDILSVLTLAIFYPHGFNLVWIMAGLGTIAILYVLHRWRVYGVWPYVVTTAVLWICLHSTGVHGALAGVILAAFLPTRPTPAVGPLLAQAATALATLEAEQNGAAKAGSQRLRLEEEAVWDWASRNLSAASDRLLSPADRIERAVSPWTAYLVLPLFAFSAAGIGFNVNLSAAGAANVIAGVVLGLVIGKPLGISIASWVAVKSGIAIAPEGISPRYFLGAACLCGIGDTVSLLLADQAFPHGPIADVAKIGVLIGSVLAALTGAVILAVSSPAAAKTDAVAARS
ncbi:MAG: Na+/H+ antiporter NhaA [Alphaproteobacteria bacterium]|nr:Na+/H+ antiporter NhaA [Alphaproteobacteria bacterium]